MRFDALEEFGRNARLMLQKAAGYYHGRDITAEAVDGFTDIIELSSIDEPDVSWMREYTASDDYSYVSEELEGYLDCNKLHDKKVFDAWKDHLFLHFQSLPKLVNQMLSELSDDDFDSVPELSEDYKDMRELARDMVAVLMDKMDSIEVLVGEIIRRYGLTGMPHLSLQSLSCFSEKLPENINGMGRPSTGGEAFHWFVSSGYDVEDVRLALSKEINGKMGKPAVDIIISAMKEGKLTKKRIPFKVAKKALGVGGDNASAFDKEMRKYKWDKDNNLTL